MERRKPGQGRGLAASVVAGVLMLAVLIPAGALLLSLWARRRSVPVIGVMQKNHFVEPVCKRQGLEKVIMGLGGEIDHDMRAEYRFPCFSAEVLNGFHYRFDGIPAVHEIKHSLGARLHRDVDVSDAPGSKGFSQSLELGEKELRI